MRQNPCTSYVICHLVAVLLLFSVSITTLHEGARKVRWSRPGTGKSGGARVIYFNLTQEEVVLLVAVYAKANTSNMTPSQIKKAV